MSKENFDPESAVPEVIPDEYKSLLRAASVRAAEAESLKATLSKLEIRLKELEKEAETKDLQVRLSKYETEHDKLGEAIKALQDATKESEKRIHQLASRPPPKDNSGSIVEAITSSNEKMCDSIVKSTATMAQSVLTTLEALKVASEDEDEDEEEEKEAVPVPAKKGTRFILAYDDNNRMKHVDAVAIEE